MVGYLATLAEQYLDAGRAALVADTTGHDPPAHVFLSHGEPVADHCCDGGQLTVHLETAWDEIVRRGDTRQARCTIEPRATFVLTLYRCYPGLTKAGNPPKAEALDGASENLLIDLWAIETEIFDRIAENTLFTGVSCAEITLGDITPIADEGGCAGWTIPVTVELNDRGPSGS